TNRSGNPKGNSRTYSELHLSQQRLEPRLVPQAIPRFTGLQTCEHEKFVIMDLTCSLQQVQRFNFVSNVASGLRDVDQGRFLPSSDLEHLLPVTALAADFEGAQQLRRSVSCIRWKVPRENAAALEDGNSLFNLSICLQ